MNFLKKNNIIALIVSIIILIFVVFSIILFQNIKHKTEFYAKRNIEYDYQIFSDESLKSSQIQRQKYLNRLYKIREHWRVDALKSRESIRPLLQNRDRRKFVALSQIIPRTPRYELTEKDYYVPGGHGESRKMAIGFSWQVTHYTMDLDSFVISDSLKPFKEKADFPLSYSGGAGRKNLILWFSGRITERTMEDNPALSNPVVGMPAYIDVETEIEPGFDFLKP